MTNLADNAGSRRKKTYIEYNKIDMVFEYYETENRINMAHVVVKKDEPIERALYRFKKFCSKEEIRSDYEKTIAYTKPSKKRESKKYKAIRRMKKMAAKKKRLYDEPL